MNKDRCLIVSHGVGERVEVGEGYPIDDQRDSGQRSPHVIDSSS